MIGKLKINDIKAYGYHGTHPAERDLGQVYYINMEIYFDAELACTTDKIENTINYVEIYKITKEIVETTQCHLIEQLAYTLVNNIISKYNNIIKLVVSIKKEKIPVNADLQSVEFILTYPFEK